MHWGDGSWWKALFFAAFLIDIPVDFEAAADDQTFEFYRIDSIISNLKVHCVISPDLKSIFCCYDECLLRL